MNSILRVSAMVNRVKAGNPSSCYEQMLHLLEQQEDMGSDLIVFPRMALCPPSSGSLLKNPCIADECEDYLEQLKVYTEKLSAYVLVGCLKLVDRVPYEVYAVFAQGKLVGYLPCEELPAGCEDVLPADSIFRVNDMTFTILPCELDELAMKLPEAAMRGAQCVICPSYSPVTAETFSVASACAKTLSAAYGIGLVLCNGGCGDTSSPLLYKGLCEIYECGSLMGSADSAFDSPLLSCDLDSEIIRSQQRFPLKKKSDFALETTNHPEKLLRNLSKAPYLPANAQKQKRYLDHLFELQVQSLADRMSNTGLNKLVVGVSGGLDSTLALLVCQKALERLELPAQNLIGITMPGFGTTDRTYYNALSLIAALGGENRDISIKASVLQHFEDIRHDPTVKDITYENAQARERTQILFDIANSCRGLVVGTGDMSEAALGWCTFNGDHMASYNVNVCLNKSVIRKMVTHLSHGWNNKVGEVLRDIVDTPVSPELLPPDESGKIAQKTEDILGSYDLHDFFLYYVLKYNMRPQKIYYYACVAFEGVFEAAYIKEKLCLFFRRFITSQFKRSCAPDFAKITELCLADYVFPSDCSPQTLLHQLEKIEAVGIEDIMKKL